MLQDIEELDITPAKYVEGLRMDPLVAELPLTLCMKLHEKQTSVIPEWSIRDKRFVTMMRAFYRHYICDPVLQAYSNNFLKDTIIRNSILMALGDRPIRTTRYVRSFPAVDIATITLENMLCPYC